MSHSNNLVASIRNTVDQVAELAYPEQSDLATALVFELRQQLGSYVQLTPPEDRDPKMLQTVLAAVGRATARAQQAHAEVTTSLDALKLGKSAVHAYQGETGELLDMQ